MQKVLYIIGILLSPSAVASYECVLEEIAGTWTGTKAFSNTNGQTITKFLDRWSTVPGSGNIKPTVPVVGTGATLDLSLQNPGSYYPPSYIWPCSGPGCFAEVVFNDGNRNQIGRVSITQVPDSGTKTVGPVDQMGPAISIRPSVHLPISIMAETQTSCEKPRTISFVMRPADSSLGEVRYQGHVQRRVKGAPLTVRIDRSQINLSCTIGSSCTTESTATVSGGGVVARLTWGPAEGVMYVSTTGLPTPSATVSNPVKDQPHRVTITLNGEEGKHIRNITVTATAL